jgi:hypothetical protein
MAHHHNHNILHNEKLWNSKFGCTKPKTIEVVYKLPPTPTQRQHFELIKAKKKN